LFDRVTRHNARHSSRPALSDILNYKNIKSCWYNHYRALTAAQRISASAGFAKTCDSTADRVFFKRAELSIVSGHFSFVFCGFLCVLYSFVLCLVVLSAIRHIANPKKLTPQKN
jgi:hypothetical protein